MAESKRGRKLVRNRGIEKEREVTGRLQSRNWRRPESRGEGKKKGQMVIKKARPIISEPLGKGKYHKKVKKAIRR